MAQPHAGARAPLQRAGGRAALELLNEPLRRGEGSRTLYLGDSGMGKTYVARIVAEQPGKLALIHDTKAAPDFPAALQLRNVAALEAMPLEEVEGARAVAFRGDPFAGVVCTVEEVAELAVRLARARVPVRLVVGELDEALSEGGKTITAPSLRVAYTQGRAMGLCVEATTQTPQRVPQPVLDQATAVCLWRLGPRALNYLDGVCMFDGEMLETVEALDVGEFVIHRPGGYRWNRTVYRF